MLGVQLRSQWGFNHQYNISVRSHRSTERLATPPPIGSSPETTFWNIVFCGNYLMSGVETQLEVKQFCTHPWKRETGSSQWSQRLMPKHRNPGRPFPNLYCLPRRLTINITQRARFDSIWTLPHNVTVKNQVVSIVHVIPMYWNSSYQVQVFFWFLLSSGGWEVRRVWEKGDKMFSLLPLSVGGGCHIPP